MISVLYEDDKQDLLETLNLVLERQPGFQVSTAASAREALAMEKLHTFDAVIADYEMPEIDGIQFLKLILERYPDLPFIIFTGKGREEIVIEAINNGADYYVRKGGDPAARFAELAHMVRHSAALRASRNQIVRLNRLYSVMSRINEAVVRIRDRFGLMKEACKIAIHEGGFVAAWIGLENPSTGEVQSVVAQGNP